MSLGYDPRRSEIFYLPVSMENCRGEQFFAAPGLGHTTCWHDFEWSDASVDGSKPFRPDNVTGFFTSVRDSLGLQDVWLHDMCHFTAAQYRCRFPDRRGLPWSLRPVRHLRVYSRALEERDRAGGGRDHGQRTDARTHARRRAGDRMTALTEVTITGLRYWVSHVDQLVQLLDSSASPVIADPSGQAASEGEVAHLNPAAGLGIQPP